MAHTPGPWTLTIDDDTPDEIQITHPTQAYVATVWGSDPEHITKRQLSDAKLIAMAPTMRAALQKIANLVTSANDNRAQILALCDDILRITE